MNKRGNKDKFLRELVAAGFSLRESEIAWDEPEGRADPAITAGHHCESDHCLDHRLKLQFTNIHSDDD